MDRIFDYISQNKEWLFSGIGVVVITSAIPVVWSLFRRVPTDSASQPIGKNSDSVSTNQTKLGEQQAYKFPKLDNRVQFSDGKVAEVCVSSSVQIIDPYLYTSHNDPFDILIHIVDTQLRQSLESIAIIEARTRRQEIEKELVASLQKTFNKYGVQLHSLNIGSINELDRLSTTPGSRAKEYNN